MRRWDSIRSLNIVMKLNLSNKKRDCFGSRRVNNVNPHFSLQIFIFSYAIFEWSCTLQRTRSHSSTFHNFNALSYVIEKGSRVYRAEWFHGFRFYLKRSLTVFFVYHLWIMMTHRIKKHQNVKWPNKIILLWIFATRRCRELQ